MIPLNVLAADQGHEIERFAVAVGKRRDAEAEVVETMSLFDWINPRRPTGVLVLLLPAVGGWTALYWLADILLPMIGIWTHLVVPAGAVILLALAVRILDARRA